MSNIRRELQKVAFSPNIFNPIIGAITKKIVRTGVRESILASAQEKQLLQAPDQEADTSLLAPSPTVDATRPAAPTIIRFVPVTTDTTQKEGTM